ncbi:ABC transporter ATP-binding protein [Tessaracoccus sp. OH4464_COT-324]|uniref:ABC transporter ATP-binding protein n=1 Tax=Tessaracoccus sp. OH4464_COT-324 TaxID=2491059 RepID=UPI000F62C7F7|nr:ABC transporter ATP-binding protein [Tessaracoccus sp. OH4464_COT-324]RRD47088.1 ABC transporter ATP-binding protein [Tessaracoccus sp. OH4464_COT-324]
MTTPPDMSSYAAAAVDLTKVYGSGAATVHALAGVDVRLAKGEFTAIMGPSGSGKSTLMHLLAGLDRPTAGDVYLAGSWLGKLSDKQATLLRRERVGFIFQNFNLLPMYTAKQNILLPLDLAGRKPDPEWFDQLIQLLGLDDRLTHLPSELSGGQQQRVAIARALITRPDVIFADEPTGNLDSRSGGQVLSFLRTCVRELSQTVIMVTHDAVAASHASRVLLIADGLLAGEITDPTPEAVNRSLDLLRTEEVA